MKPDVELDGVTRFMQLLGGKWVTAAVSAAAKLRVADVLRDEPRPIEELAPELDAVPGHLTRLLRVLHGLGLVEEVPGQGFRLTEFGHYLRDDEFGEIARYVGRPFLWNPYALLEKTIRTGESAFSLEHGSELFDYVGDGEDELRNYHGGVDSFSRREAENLANVFDFSDARTVVDIGGGAGTLATELLAAHESLQLIVVDLNEVVEIARARIEASGNGARAKLVGGSFFDELPAGHDVYVLKHILHNWGDEDAARILKTCRAAMRPDSRLLLVEGLLMPGNIMNGTLLMDVEMLANYADGRERTRREYKVLARDAGFRLESTTTLYSDTRLMVFSPTTGG